MLSACCGYVNAVFYISSHVIANYNLTQCCILRGFRWSLNGSLLSGDNRWWHISDGQMTEEINTDITWSLCFHYWIILALVQGPVLAYTGILVVHNDERIRFCNQYYINFVLSLMQRFFIAWLAAFLCVGDGLMCTRCCTVHWSVNEGSFVLCTVSWTSILLFIV